MPTVVKRSGDISIVLLRKTKRLPRRFTPRNDGIFRQFFSFSQLTRCLHYGKGDITPYTPPFFRRGGCCALARRWSLALRRRERG